MRHKAERPLRTEPVSRQSLRSAIFLSKEDLQGSEKQTAHALRREGWGWPAEGGKQGEARDPGLVIPVCVLPALQLLVFRTHCLAGGRGIIPMPHLPRERPQAAQGGRSLLFILFSLWFHASRSEPQCQGCAWGHGRADGPALSPGTGNKHGDYPTALHTVHPCTTHSALHAGGAQVSALLLATSNQPSGESNGGQGHVHVCQTVPSDALCSHVVGLRTVCLTSPELSPPDRELSKGTSQASLFRRTGALWSRAEKQALGPPSPKTYAHAHGGRTQALCRVLAGGP